jgi:hypothetical protein
LQLAHDSGIRFWELPEADSRFETLTLVGEEGAMVLANRALAALRDNGYTQSFRWSTWGRALEGGEIAERTVARQLESDPPGVVDTYVGPLKAGQIPTKLSRLRVPLDDESVDALSYYRRVAVVSMRGHRAEELSTVHAALRPLTPGIEPDAVARVLASNPDWIVLRILDDECERPAVQVIGGAHTVSDLARRMGLDAVEPGSGLPDSQPPAMD